MTKANPTPQPTPTFNQSQEPPIKIDWLGERTPVVSSVDVARHFGKKHQHVLRDIERLCSNLPESFHASNFGRMFTEVQIGNGATRKTPAYNLTRDGFSLLVMGFTGKAALKWKLRYIEAFNALEKAVLQNATELARTAGFEAAREELKANINSQWTEGHETGLKESVYILSMLACVDNQA